MKGEIVKKSIIWATLFVSSCGQMVALQSENEVGIAVATQSTSQTVSGGSYILQGDRFPLLRLEDGRSVVLLRDETINEPMLPIFTNRQRSGGVLDGSGCTNGEFAVISDRMVTIDPLQHVPKGLCFDVQS